MDTMASFAMNFMKVASDWLNFAFDAPFARAVVFGVHIGGQLSTKNMLIFSTHLEEFNFSWFPVGHLFVEVLLVVVIIFLLSQKSYKPPKRPLTKKV